MHPIIPHLWFNKEAKEAIEFYTALLPNSKIAHVSTIHNTPSGDSDIVSFELAGQPFMAISADSLFKFNPSISFHIRCQSVEEVDILWAKLIEGGSARMELGEYPFSKRYGWLADKYGLNWQIIHSDPPITQTIVPTLMFTGQLAGKAEEAMNFYASVFPNASSKVLARYPDNAVPDKPSTVSFGQLLLNGQQFGAMDSAQPHDFTFNEAISFIVTCENQDEIDQYWGKLSADPASEQCGWCKDKYGVSWQIVPTIMNEVMSSGDQAKIDRVTQAFLPMKKFDIAALQKAAEGK